MRLTPSKKGEDLANLAYATITEDCRVPEEDVKKLVSGVVADGALVKGNEPFKLKCRELINEQLTFKWDLLHLINRAHIAARGKTSHEVEFQATVGFDDEPSASAEIPRTNIGNIGIKELLSYIQCQAKKWRSGISYTDLSLSDFTFKRPKVWSSTRMSLYEYDQVLRFLENNKYWDVPWHIEVLAQLYCPVLFAVKVMSKKVQKTDISAAYVQ